VATNTVFTAHELHIRTVRLPVSVARVLYTDTGSQLSQGDLCQYVHTSIGPAIVHRCPQLLASLEIHPQNCEKSAHQSK